MNIAKKNNFTSPTNDKGKAAETRLDNRRTVESESKRLPLGTITQSEAFQRTIEATISRGSEGTSSPKKNTGWNKYKWVERLADISKNNKT